MIVKRKLMIKGLNILWWNHRARKMAKKIAKFPEDERYPEIYKNNYVLKKAKKLAKILKVRLTVKGFEDLPKAPALLVPNHSSSFDGSLILMALENPSPVSTDINLMPTFIVKDDLLENKKTAGYLKILSTIFLNRKNPRDAIKSFDEFGKYIKQEKKYGVIFPEGTRSKDGKIHEFKAGALRIAKKEYLPIIPVTINNAQGITNLSRKEIIDVEIIFHPVIKPIKFVSIDTHSLANNVKRQIEKAYKPPKVARDASFESKVA